MRLKRDPRAKLFSLPAEDQALLASWMLNGKTYAECRDLVKDRFGLEVKSLDPFVRFYQDVCGPILLARAKDMKRRVNTIEELAEDLRYHSLRGMFKRRSKQH